MGFTQIPGMLTLEQATAELVHVAEVMQRTHINEAFHGSKLLQRRLFEIRKEGLVALLDLIEEYLEQIPLDKEEAEKQSIEKQEHETLRKLKEKYGE